MKKNTLRSIMTSVVLMIALVISCTPQAAKADNLNDYSVNLYSHEWTSTGSIYSNCPYGGLHTHTNNCKHTYSYISSYYRNCGKDEHTHNTSCYKTNSVTYTTTTANCSGCSGTSGYTTKVGHSAWSCSMCDASQGAVGVCWTHTFNCPVGNSGMTYTYGTATHTCKSLICTKEEHSHTGNSSSGGGCYGGRNYSSGTDYTNCPLYSKLHGAEHRSHDSSCVYTYNTSGVTYHCDKNSVYSNDVLNGTIKVRNVPGDPFTYGGRYITLSAPDRRGYTFKGWFGDNDFTEENPSTDNISIDAANAGNKTYTVKWELNKYKITTELHGGKTDKEIPAEYNVESEDIILPEPKRKGMKFVG